MAIKKKESKLFRFFDFNRDNRPDAIEEDTTPTLKRYFKLLGRRLWKLISLNIMMLPMILTVLLIVYIYFGFEKTPIQNNVIFSQLYGANLIEPSTSSTLLLDLFGAQLNIPVFNNTASYILRSMVRGEPVFLFSDYFYAVRRNLKQGFLMGLIDVVAIFLLGFDLMYFASTPSTYWNNVCYYAIFALIFLYFFMRFYLYLMLVTFDLSIRKLFKNALIFTVLGWKRNLMAVIGILIITAINIVLFPLFALTPLGIAIPLILPFLYYLAVTSFTTAYAAYPIIDRYMIEPYRTNDEDEESED